MRIAGIDALQLRLPEVQQIFDGTQDVLVVRVTTDENVTGYGEVVSCSAVAKAIIEAPRSAPRRHGLGVALMGADPLLPDRCWEVMYEASRWYGRQGAAMHAMSGIDQALWDIVGKAAGKPLVDVWGRKRSRVRAYASVLFPPTAREAQSLTARILEQGFTAIKFGYGSFGENREHDIEVLDAIHGVAHDSADVMVDAGRVWSEQTAVDRGHELFERYGITFLEEPLHEDNIAGYAHIAPRIRGRIAAGETEATLASFERLIDAGVSVVQPDVGRAGSLSICRQISTLAHARAVWCISHCFGTAINLAASLHWMASAEEAPFIEFPLTESALRTKLVANPPTQIDGWVSVPDRPGLGIEIDPQIATSYEYRSRS